MRIERVKTVIGLVVTVITVAAFASPRTDADFTKLGQWSSRTSKGRDALPAVFSTDAQKDKEIHAALASLLQEGAKKAEGMYEVSEAEFKQASVPIEERLVLRLTHDRNVGRFFVGPQIKDTDGLSSGAYLFYENFFMAYAGLHPEFRKADSPLARGVAALAALSSTFRGDLALLPDFKAEAAAALWLLNADTGLPSALVANGPENREVREQLGKAINTALGNGATATDMVEALLGEPGQRSSAEAFDLRALFGGSDSLRDAAWKHALNVIPQPGLLAEVGIAVWSGRTNDVDRVGTLDKIFETRMLEPLLNEMKVRGIQTNEVAKAAKFDVSELTSIFGFVWTYRPEFEQWRQEARAAASLPEAQRVAKANELKSRLSGLLTPGVPKSVSQAASLCALVAEHPTSRGARQPVISLDYLERSIKDQKTKEETGKYVESAQVKLQWEMMRPVLGRGVEGEKIVFIGSASVEAPEGVKTPVTKEVTAKPEPAGNVTAAGDDKEKPGPKQGPSVGDSGVGDGINGTDGKGDTPAPAPKKLKASNGFAPDTSVYWRPDMDRSPTNVPLQSACSNGLLGTLVANILQKNVPPRIDTVWAEVAESKPIPECEGWRIELENGQTVVAGADQEFFLFSNTIDPGSKKAAEMQPGDKLMGDGGKPVAVKSITNLVASVTLIAPAMAVYKNLLAGGVLAKVGALEEVGGILAGMQVETPSGTPIVVEKLDKGTPVAGALEEEAGVVPTQIAEMNTQKVDAHVEIRYDIDGKERVLRVAATQKILIYVPQYNYQTYACAGTNKVDATGQGDGEHPTPAPSGAQTNATLTLAPGMLLVTATNGKDQPPRTTPLKTVTAVCGKQQEKNKKAAADQIETFVPELFNLPLLRVEGVLLHCPTRFEMVRGFALDSVVVQPPVGLPPGAPLGFADKMVLSAPAIQSFPCPDGPFLTTKWPEKTWMAARTKAIPRSQALRYVRIETERGVLLCGNSQILIAVQKGASPRAVEVPSEQVTHDPKQYDLLFINREAPRGDGELEQVPVRSAKYVYGQKPAAFAEIVGDGMAGQTNSPEGKLISRDIFFVNGFMALGENEESTRGGGSLSGGGGGNGTIAPDKNVSPQEVRVNFSLPGLEAGHQRTRENRLLFTGDERTRFNTRLEGLQQSYSQAQWGRGRIKDEKRFMRFLGLYFAPNGVANIRNPGELAAVYCEPAGNGAAPAWTSLAFREYIGMRASLLEQGIPSDLYGWSFRYIFLVTLAYETGNNAFGDALLKDYLCITMTVALGRHDDQKNRDRYYFGEQNYRLAEALHWSRDVVSVIRDGGDGRHAWVSPDGWKELLQARLGELTKAGGASSLLREDGQVNIGNLWVQLGKVKSGGGSEQVAAGLDPELVQAVQTEATGQEGSRALLLIVSPSQNPAAAFEDGTFKDGPYASKSIRNVLGILARDPGM